MSQVFENIHNNVFVNKPYPPQYQGNKKQILNYKCQNTEGGMLSKCRYFILNLV